MSRLHARCEQCRREHAFEASGVPSGWTMIWFCSILCLTAWKRKRYTAEALAAS